MSGIGRRYAHALLATLEGAAPEKVLEDLRSFGAWLGEVPGLRGAIENPGIPMAVKSELVKKLGEGAGMEPVSVRFALVVVGNRRTRQWEEMVDAFQALCDERRGILRARVRTARPLSDPVRLELMARLGKALGGSVELEHAVSPDLLGGLELRIGSTIYDGSVAGALKSLHQSLAKG
jgi:F-type H+-transporting ATPase subunit delta